LFKDDLDIVAAVIGIAVVVIPAIGFLIYLSRTCPKALRLMRLSYTTRLSGRRPAVMLPVFGLAAAAAVNKVFGGSFDLFKTVRLRIEHDICTGQFGAHTAGRSIWSMPARKLYWRDEQEEVPAEQIANCNAFQDEGFKAASDAYLDALQSLKQPPEFITQIEIQTGFVAPLLLLAGLLQYFGADWEPILAKFGRDTEELGDPLASDGSHRLRKLQAFIFDCWLLWGPSIPICNDNCERWAGGSMSSLQYGYGDENNSIELVADKKILKDFAQNFGQRKVLSFKASVTGTLKRGSDIKATKSQYLALPLAEAMQTEKRRLVLDLREDGNVRAIEGTPESSGTPYYSAYLWVLVVILGPNGRPIHEGADSARRFPWASFVPFFEHGNIADRETYVFLKRQLAEKAVRAIAHTAEELAKSHKGVRFAYACAIDDSGCGNDLAYATDDSSIKEMMRSAAAQTLTGGESPILDFEVYAKDNPYSTCKLPTILKRFYEELSKEAP